MWVVACRTVCKLHLFTHPPTAHCSIEDVQDRHSFLMAPPKQLKTQCVFGWQKWHGWKSTMRFPPGCVFKTGAGTFFLYEIWAQQPIQINVLYIFVMVVNSHSLLVLGEDNLYYWGLLEGINYIRAVLCEKCNPWQNYLLNNWLRNREGLLSMTNGITQPCSLVWKLWKLVFFLHFCC